jgi:hypothetical protein
MESSGAQPLGREEQRNDSPLSGVQGPREKPGPISASPTAQPMGVSPTSFIFHEVIPYDGKSATGGWQETDCETVRFVGPAGGFFGPPVKIDVNLVVGVPIKNQGQGFITKNRAHNESIDAANIAGMEVVSLLLDDEITPSQVPQFFINLMSVHLLIDGRRITTCSGGSNKTALQFALGNRGRLG